MATSLTLRNDPTLQQGYVDINGTTSATFTTSGITGNLTGNVTGSLTAGGSLTLATAQTATGTAVDFTGIPSWAKRITVMLNEVSTNGISPLLVQIGDSGGIENTGYISTTQYLIGGGASGSVSSTIGFVNAGGDAATVISGHMVITNLSSNLWISSNTFKGSTTYCYFGGGSKTLSNTLDRLRITTVNGTDTFDAGTINISYEG